MNVRHWLLLGILLLAVVTRCGTVNTLLKEREPRLIGPDPYHHLIRTDYAYRNDFKIPIANSYSGFPRMTYWIWSPFFDVSTALVARALDWVRQPTPYAGNVMAAALIVPIPWALAGLLVAYGFFLSSGLGGGLALLATAILSLLPVHVSFGSFGHFDHHIAEFLFFTVFLWCLKSFNEAPWGSRRATFYGVASALFGLASFCNWTGSFIYQAFAYIAWFLYLVRQSFFERSGTGELLKKVSFYTFCSLVFYFFLLPDYFYIFAMSPFEPRNYRLTPLLAVGVAYGVFVFCFLAFEFRDRLRENWPWFVGLAVLLIGGLLGWTPLGTAVGVLLEKLTYVGKSHYITAMVTEGDPLLRVENQLSFIRCIWYYTPLFFVAPLGFALFVLRERGRANPHFYLLFLAHGFFVLILTLYINRFGLYLSLHVAFYIAYPVVVFLRYLREFQFKTFPLMAAIVLLGVGNFFTVILGFFDPEMLPDDIIRVSHWIVDNTPPTSHFSDRRKQPEYGLLSFWYYGNYLAVVGQRPVHADCHQVNALETTNLFFAPGSALTLDYMAKNNLPYLLLGSLSPHIRLCSLLASGGAKTANLLFYDQMFTHFGAEGMSPRGWSPAVPELSPLYFYFHEFAWLFFEKCPPMVLEFPLKPGEEVAAGIQGYFGGRIFQWQTRARGGEDGLARCQFPGKLMVVPEKMEKRIGVEFFTEGSAVATRFFIPSGDWRPGGRVNLNPPMGQRVDRERIYPASPQMR